MARIERGLKTGGITPLTTQLADAKKLGLKIYACPNAMATFNIPLRDLPEVDQAMGLFAFMELARSTNLNWYI